MTIIRRYDVARQHLAGVFYIGHQRAELPQGRHALRVGVATGRGQHTGFIVTPNLLLVMDVVQLYVKPVKDFAKDSMRLVKRCTKPDLKGCLSSYCPLH